MSVNVLIIDGNKAPDHTFVPALAGAGYQIERTKGLSDGLHKTRTLRPDLIILNLAVPGTDELNLCRDLRTITDVPVMILAQRGTETIRAKSLDMGADEYLSRHVSSRVLLAKICALLRRATNQSNNCSTYDDGRLMVDLAARKVTLDNRPVVLTPTEFRLLSCLLENIGYTLPHKFLLRRVWESRENPQFGLLRLYIRKLRLKIEPDSTRPRYIQNSHGVGYCFHDLRV